MGYHCSQLLKITSVGAENDSAPQVTIVVVSRLTFRKGIDILIDVMPEISRRFPHVSF